MNKLTQPLLLLATAIALLAPTTELQAQLPPVLTDGVPETMDPVGIFGTNIFNLPTDSIPSSGVAPFGDPSGAVLNQVNVGAGGNLPNSFLDQEVHFSEVNIADGGDTSSQLHFFNSEVNIASGGSIGAILTIEAGGTLNVADGAGSIGSNQNINAGGTANINGGTSGGAFSANVGSTVNIGGTAAINGNLNDFDGTVNISGGSISSSTDFTSTSTANISGGTFGSNIDFDGQVAFSGGSFGSNFNVNSGATGLDGGAVVIDDITVVSGGTDIFAATIVNGGNFTASADFEIGSSGSVINGGTFGNNTDFIDDITINGGTFGTNTDIGNFSDTSTTQQANPTVTINGGTFTELDVDSGTTNIFGGTFIGGTTGVALAAGATRDNDALGTINLHGGDVQGLIEAFGNLNLYGTDFAIDGELISGESITVGEGSLLTGVLEDGNSINLVLNQGFNFINTDGSESQFPDSNEGLSFFGLFGENGNTGGTLTANGTTINVVPEPGSLSILALGALGMMTRRRRR